MDPNSLPEVGGRSIWEVVVSMDTKLDIALSKLEDHETRLRTMAPQHEIDRLETKLDVLQLKQNEIDRRPVVTPRGLVSALTATVTIAVGLLSFINYFLM